MTKAEKAHKSRLAEMGCLVCSRFFGVTDSPVELHHMRKGGWGRGDYTTLIPICYTHHRGTQGIHTLGTKAWERLFGAQEDYLQEAFNG